MSPVAEAIFNGDANEKSDLLAALEHNCQCDHALDGSVTKSCAGHQMLLNDQRALNGLVFVHRMIARLTDEEWHETTP